MAKTTAMTTFDAEIAKLAKESMAQVAGIGGDISSFSFRAGTMSFGGAPVPNNEVAVYVLDSVLVNTFYKDDYDPEEAATPDCFAIGRDAKTMAPHEESAGKVNPTCKGCPNNEFGSADKGKGKACKNRIRLAVIPAGTLRDGRFEAFDDEDTILAQQVAQMNLPPTSLTSWASYVKQIVGSLETDPMVMCTKVKLVSDPVKQFVVQFTSLAKCPDAVKGALLQMRKGAQEGLTRPYQKREDKPAKPAKKRKF